VLHLKHVQAAASSSSSDSENDCASTTPFSMSAISTIAPPKDSTDDKPNVVHPQAREAKFFKKTRAFLDSDEDDDIDLKVSSGRNVPTTTNRDEGLIVQRVFSPARSDTQLEIDKPSMEKPLRQTRATLEATTLPVESERNAKQSNLKFAAPADGVVINKRKQNCGETHRESNAGFISQFVCGGAAVRFGDEDDDDPFMDKCVVPPPDDEERTSKKRKQTELSMRMKTQKSRAAGQNKDRPHIVMKHASLDDFEEPGTITASTSTSKSMNTWASGVSPTKIIEHDGRNPEEIDLSTTLFPEIIGNPFFDTDATDLELRGSLKNQKGQTTESLESDVLSGRVPLAINRYLKEYQRDGIKFMWKLKALSGGGILADDSTFNSLFGAMFSLCTIIAVVFQWDSERPFKFLLFSRLF
jgi:hypothetical protein